MPGVLIGRGFGMHEHQRACDVRCCLLQYLQPFAAHAGLEAFEASDITTRKREACNEAAADRIADPSEHNRHISGERLEHREDEIGEYEDDIRGPRKKFGGVKSKWLRVAIAPACFEA